MRVLIAQIRRKPVAWSILLLMLTLAVTASNISVCAFDAIRRQANSIGDSYVTVAIMKEAEFTDEVYDSAATTAALCSGSVVNHDSRCMLGAEVKGCHALTSGAIERTDYRDIFDLPSYATAVLAVTCVSVETNPSPARILEIDGKEIELPSYEEYSVCATIKDVVSLAEGYESPKPGDDIRLNLGAHREDGTVPFEPGKTYLVFGLFYDYPIYTTFVEDKTPTGEFAWKSVRAPYTDDPYMFSLFSGTGIDITGNIQKPTSIEESPYELPREDWQRCRFLGQREDGIFYYYPMQGSNPDATEYTGSVEDFLKSEKGRIWNETYLPLCAINHCSASVILTDNIRSIYMFNNGDAGMTEGRYFTDEEYEKGNAVCVISAEYAKYNSLHVGDCIEITYYDTEISIQTVTEGGDHNSEVVTNKALRHGVLAPYNKTDVQKSYEIIGIYSASAFRGGLQLYTADTIFVPKASVPNAVRYERPEIRALQSFVLRNGSEEQFLEAIKHGRYQGENAELFFDNPESIDFSGDFLIFNQQFDKTAGNIEVMQSNARRLLCLSLLGFVIILAVVRYFEARLQRETVLTMKKLGVSASRVRWELFGVGMLLNLAATLLGGALTGCLYQEITRRAEVGALPLPMATLLFSAAAVFVFLTATTFFSTAKRTNINLMQKNP